MESREMDGEAAAGVEIKIGALEAQDAKAKAPPPPPPPPPPPSQAAAKDTMPPTEATEADAKSKAAAALASNQSSVAAASMLAQVYERAFMEHQLAACHFTFYSFCEHLPVAFPSQTDP